LLLYNERSVFCTGYRFVIIIPHPKINTYGNNDIDGYIKYGMMILQYGTLFFIPKQGQQYKTGDIQQLDTKQSGDKKQQFGFYLFGIGNYKGGEKTHYPQPQAGVNHINNSLSGYQQLKIIGNRGITKPVDDLRAATQQRIAQQLYVVQVIGQVIIKMITRRGDTEKENIEVIKDSKQR